MASVLHEAQRYRQIAGLERQLRSIGIRITDAKDEVKLLQKEYESVLLQLRAAARDEGELQSLPLLDMLEATEDDADDGAEPAVHVG